MIFILMLLLRILPRPVNSCMMLMQLYEQPTKMHVALPESKTEQQSSQVQSDNSASENSPTAGGPGEVQLIVLYSTTTSRKVANEEAVKHENRSGGMEPKASPMIKTHHLSHLIDEYNVNCGDQEGRNETHCNVILLELEPDLHVTRELKHRQTRHILEPKFLCWTITPFRIDWYNPLKQICCNGIHDKVTGTEICCGNDVINETHALGCCRMDTYNKQEYLCCSDRLHKKTSSTLECCGSTAYDTSANAGCCGDHFYDLGQHYCCDNRTFYENIGKHNNHGGCCGAESYDKRCYACNETSDIPTIYPMYDPEMQICCQGRIKMVKGNKTACCGRKLIDPYIQACGDDSIVIQRPRYENLIITRLTTEVTSLPMETPPVKVTINPFDMDLKEDEPTTKAPEKFEIALFKWLGISCGSLVLVIVIVKVILKSRKNCMVLKCLDDKAATSESFLNKPTGSTTSCTGITLPYSLLTVTTNGNEVITKIASQSDRALTSNLSSVSSCLKKHIIVDKKNVTSELYSDEETQTFDTKRSNVRNMFGNEYQFSCYLGPFNLTLTWDRSDSKLILPLSAVGEHTIETFASTFDDIPSIFEKLSLSSETRLVSPVVEFRLPGVKALKDCAVVELPFIGNPDHIQVWKCPSDEGMYATLESQRVPIVEDENTDAELFCRLENGKARIYTKSFSTFYCTCQEPSRSSFCQRAFLFASYKKINERKEVRLNLYIADELHKFADYNQRMKENENRGGRELKYEQELKLHDRLSGKDFLTLSMAITGDCRANMMHKLHPTTNELLEKEHKTVYLSELDRCCHANRALPYQVGWYLENKPNTQPADIVQCVVDVYCNLADNSSDALHTPLVIDELQLRAKDRDKVPSEEDRAAYLKDYLVNNIPNEVKAQLNEELKKRCRLRRYSEEDHDFCKGLENLYSDLQPASFTRTVATVLDDMHHDAILDNLLKQNYISKAHIKRSFQACAKENEFSETNRNICVSSESIGDSVNGNTHQACRRELNRSIFSSYDVRTAEATQPSSTDNEGQVNIEENHTCRRELGSILDSSIENGNCIIREEESARERGEPSVSERYHASVIRSGDEADETELKQYETTL